MCWLPCFLTGFLAKSGLIRERNCGVIIRHDDAEEVARAVKSLYDDPLRAKEMGERGFALITGAHSQDHRAQTTHESY